MILHPAPDGHAIPGRRPWRGPGDLDAEGSPVSDQTVWAILEVLYLSSFSSVLPDGGAVGAAVIRRAPMADLGTVDHDLEALVLPLPGRRFSDHLGRPIRGPSPLPPSAPPAPG